MKKTHKPSPFVIRIGAYRYTVKIHDPAAGPMLGSDGTPYVSLPQWETRTIWIIGTPMPSQQRLDALVYCLWGAYTDRYGIAQAGHGLASQVATFVADVMRQVERQGGVEALMQLPLTVKPMPVHLHRRIVVEYVDEVLHGRDGSECAALIVANNTIHVSTRAPLDEQQAARARCMECLHQPELTRNAA
jgi:hypothetical protein